MAVDSTTIPNQESWRFVKRKRFDDLLRGPLGSRVSRNIEMYDLVSVMAKYDEREQNLEGRGRNREEVDGDDVFRVIIEERTPSLRRRFRGADPILVDR